MIYFIDMLWLLLLTNIIVELLVIHVLRDFRVHIREHTLMTA